MEIIDFETFGFCDNLSELWIPDSIKEIEGRAFWHCDNLKKVEFGNQSKLKIIHWFAFSNCIKLKEIEIPKRVKKIDYEVFLNCKSLKKVTFRGKMPKIKANAFQKIHSKAVFQTPKKYKSEYQRKLKKKHGYKSTMKIV